MAVAAIAGLFPVATGRCASVEQALADAARVPLVYTNEFTGAHYPLPPLPAIGNLPAILPLPDPFCWANDPTNGLGSRSTRFADWSRHRAEIKAQIEHFEIGCKPAVDPADIDASYSGSDTSGTLTVRVTNAVAGVSRTLTLNCAISIPSGSGPFPVMIGMNSPHGSIGLGGRPIATITYRHNQVTTYNNPRNTDPFFQLYPDQNIDNTGQYAAWAWGFSRIVDGLHKLSGRLGSAQLDLQRIGCTGCSYAGKMALFCGALDERVALTIPQESGGGGVPNWRYSYQNEPSGSVEGLAQTSSQWFANSLFDFANASTALLPHDHHQLLAMIAPRAVFATGNPDGAAWLSNPSCYVSCKAVERIYDTFGISDRFGYNINGGKSHCARNAELDSDVHAFLDKFLMGDTHVDTASIRHVPAAYSNIDHVRWTAWWGTTEPVFPGATGDYDTQTFEPECAVVGSAQQILADATASNGKCVTVTPGNQSVSAAPVGASNLVTLPFTLTNSAPKNFLVAGRVHCASADDDSFWVRVDGGSWTMLNGLPTRGWAWANFGTFSLSAGAHTLDIGYREDGARLDKISISDNPFTPSGTGDPAALVCPQFSAMIINRDGLPMSRSSGCGGEAGGDDCRAGAV